ncbi:sigma-54 dependent DNA-binding response regulator [Desulforapulum autotrophicum HRM2]|uniref:Sigma-54 dependent DNA-binding response regulator n=1 Tax=Desulforapulum autotrophicum (strain ATCC 43914 / DSM 3382 / VKM B-1955 / HRM2) TaxID=177437 RepID=C0QAQ9_DESAH|nr:sigma-54 dependent transcriptional regulator [Desulforapulum autotrophicum]ACN16842.1 sigma-54 dependent DNA-binding response regulator [Desulforapulum autotrophicum HRM2]
MDAHTLFIIDDEETIRDSLAFALESTYTLQTFETGQEALAVIPKNPPDLILLDIGLPDISGIEVLQQIKGTHPGIPVIMITAFEEITTVITAMKSGAYDYLVKPLHMDALEIVIANALETVSLKKEVKGLQEQLIQENLPCFIGESEVIQEMLTFVDTVAKSPDTPILILGETGTGKELIASAVHHRSPNFRSNFVTVNCAAIPRDLIESEIFGYERGAFSGANPNGKRGLIEDAHRGTLFLDEIGDLSLKAQAALLRFLETGEFYRIGGTRKHHVQARIVSATNKDLEQMIQAETFRRDLFFRIGVIKLEIPSLNERRSDILSLATFFLEQFNRKFSKKVTTFSEQALQAIMTHHWTGNVRELKNIMERGVLVAKGTTLTPGDLGFSEKPSNGSNADTMFAPLTTDGIDLPLLRQEMDKFYIKESLTLTNGNESQAAKLLNINHHTFRYHRKKCMDTDQGEDNNQGDGS